MMPATVTPIGHSCVAIHSSVLLLLSSGLSFAGFYYELSAMNYELLLYSSK
jgi:hypothetical protein